MIYEEALLQFYCNMSVGGGTISTKVGRAKVDFDWSMLANILGVPFEGSTGFFNREAGDEAVQDLTTHAMVDEELEVIREEKGPMTLSSLKPLAHLVGVMVAHNIYPKKGGIKKTPDWSLFLIFFLIHIHQINLADVLFDGMVEAAISS